MKLLTLTKISIISLMIVGFIFSISTYNYDREVNRIISSNKVVMITFDDGPSACADEKILDVLDKYDVKATFFMTGINLSKYVNNTSIKKVVDRMIQGGHSIGNHSYYHNEYINNQVQLVKELNDVNDMIKHVYNENGKKIESKDIPIRMPYLQYYRGLGYVQKKVANPYWVRGYLGTDYLEEKTGKEEILNQYFSHLRNGQIFVAHTRDYAKVWLPEFLETLLKHGYAFANFTKDTPSYYLNYGKLGS
ncbi:polysaccharide deacetylase family protein [Mesoplasma melaleucae]|uniref:Peptidoglycan-N-acetylglucosamine deacetylase n=1 Tax=Mesoplasma melaleucae TaxID=81459 RepID=A0A2K8NZT2_9MOLU|nr:polysaccharide deacetylase family protein [Mesoplasma melaleucae]ATZ18251.1 peptidoglycan-N-acetylglucosamine deacetylase [Mesoplasma melaleucae]